MKIGKNNKKYIIMISGGAFLLLILAIVMCLRTGAGKKSVGSVAVIRGDIIDSYTEDGIFQTGMEYQVVSKANGTVKSIEVRENMEVKKGDLLLVIDDRDLVYEKEIHESNLSGYQAQVEQKSINQMMTASPQEYLESAKQDLASSQAKLKAVKTSADGMNELYQTGSVSKMEWEQTQAEYLSAQSAYTVAKNRYEESQRFLEFYLQEGIDKESLNSRFYESMDQGLTASIQSEKTAITQLEDQIMDCKITAGCDGIIMSLPAKDISLVQAGQVLAVISSNQEPVIETDVLTSIEPYLTVGAPVVLTQKLRNQEYQYTGTVSDIYGFAVLGTSALGMDEYRVQVNVAVDPGQDIQLKPGYGFKVKFTLYEGRDQLIIPTNALFAADQQDFVFVIEEGVVARKNVTVAYRSSSQAIISEGLEEGELIISNVDSEDIYEGMEAFYSR